MKLIKKIYSKILNIKTDFDKLFFTKEYLSLTEEFGINFFLIVFILFLTFFAFSFSIGSMEYLDKRMNDPFTNWVDIPVTINVKNQRENIYSYFTQDSIKNKINLNNLSDYIIYFRNFYTGSLDKVYQLKGRTVQDTSSLFKKIISKNNLISTTNVRDINSIYGECGIIVTEKLLKDLDFTTTNPKHIFLEENEGLIALNIAAIVKDLPNNSQFITSNSLYNISFDPYTTGFIVLNETTNILQLIAEEHIREKLINELKEKNIMVKPDLDNFKNDNKISYSIIFPKPLSFSLLKKKVNKLLKDKVTYRIFLNNECQEYNEHLKFPHRLAFNFDKLDNIRIFKNMMKEKFKVEVNMAQIEAKENFSMVSNLTFILSLILFIFSIVSIIFFINSILTKHLQKIKENLGTLKAFGINNKKMLSIYIKIIFTFLLVSGFLAYVINVLITFSINLYIGVEIFKFYSIYIFIIFLLIIVFSLLNSKYSILKVLKSSPGNLIYNRK